MSLSTIQRIWLAIPFPSRTTVPLSWESTNWDINIKMKMKTKHCKIITKGHDHSVVHELVDARGNTIAKDTSLANLHRRILKMPTIKLLNNNQPFPTTQH